MSQRPFNSQLVDNAVKMKGTLDRIEAREGLSKAWRAKCPELEKMVRAMTEEEREQYRERIN